jgi:hypothetical protein
MPVKFPQISNAQATQKGFFNEANMAMAIDHLQNLPYVMVTAELAGGASGATTNDYVFTAPCKGEVLEVKFIKTVVNTGSSNEPVVKLMNGSNEVAASAAIALSGGAVGDVHSLVLDATKVALAAGDKLIHRIVTPSATVTVALKGKLQIIWKPVA